MDCSKFTLPTAKELDELIDLICPVYTQDDLKEFLDCVEKHRKANLANLEIATKMKCDGMNLAKNIFEYIHSVLSLIPTTVEECVWSENVYPHFLQYRRLVQLFDEKE